MILDSNLIFCEGLALSTAGASDVLDLTEGGDALGNELLIVCQCSEKAAGGTSFDVAIQTDDDSAFSAAKTLFSSGDILTADAAAGAKLFAVRVPRGTERYMRANVTASGSFTGGKLDIFLVVGDTHSWEDI